MKTASGFGRAIKKHQSFYGSVDVYDIDVMSVPSGQWLRTNVLAYYYAKLQHEYDQQAGTITTTNNEKKDEEPPTSVRKVEGSGSEGGASTTTTAPSSMKRKPKMWLADTSVVHAMVCFNDASIGPADHLLGSDLLLLPVCDYGPMDGGVAKLNSGQHWSVLRVFIRRNQAAAGVVVSFRHLDSAAMMNHKLAMDIVDLLKRYYLSNSPNTEKGGLTTFVDETVYANPNGTFIDSAGVVKTEKPSFTPFPQQGNGSDCGMYVCTAGRAYVRALGQRGEWVDPVFEDLGVTVEGAQQLRDDLFLQFTADE